jgi:hypothetical protein
MELKLCSGNCFQFWGNSNLKLWPCDAVWILWAKWNISYAPETVFSFKVIVTLIFDLVTQKSTGVFYPIWTIIPWSLNIVGQIDLKLCFRNCLKVIVTFDLVTPNLIGVFYPIWTIMLWSLNTVSQMELKLCSGNCFQFKGNCDLDLWYEELNTVG